MKTKDVVVSGPNGAADVKMAEQLTAQYRAAVGGMIEVVKFGAMMLALRDELRRRVQAGEIEANAKGGGVEGWLREHAAEVSRPTALRFMALAEAVRELAKLGPGVDLVHLLTASASTLQGAMAKKRAAIENLIEGKSQRQLLLMIADDSTPPARTGGDNEFQKFLRENFTDLVGTKLGRCPQNVREAWAQAQQEQQLPPDEVARLETQQIRTRWSEVADFIRKNTFGRSRTFVRLDRSEMEALAEVFEGAAQQIRGTLKG